MTVLAATASADTPNRIDNSATAAADLLWLKANQSRFVLAIETGYEPFLFVNANGQADGFALSNVDGRQENEVLFRLIHALTLEDVHEPSDSRGCG